MSRSSNFSTLPGARICLLLAALVALAMTGPASAQVENESPSSVLASFELLKVQDEQSIAAGADQRQRADRFAAWMAASDWPKLPLWEQRILYDHLGPDEIDYPRVSIRWSGTLTPLLTDQYTLVQMRQLVQDPVMKVWIDGTLVLDSTPQPAGERISPLDNRFKSQTLDLIAGRPVAIRVELSHDVDVPIEYSLRAPMAVLAWETAAAGRSLIPTEAFSPPAGFSDGNRNGLKGEYFSGPGFDTAQLKATRLDPAIEMVWPWGPIVPVHAAELSQLRDEAWQKMTSDVYLDSLAGEDLRAFLDRALWQTSHRLTLSRRRELVEVLLDRPALIQAMSTYDMGKLMESIYMLPGREHLELLVAWSLARPQPRTEAGTYPGWGTGSYQSFNLEYYWLIGHFLQGPYWPDVERLWRDHLRRPDGQCNLPLAYATSFTAHIDGKGRALLDLLKASATDESLSGDQRATWYFALAFAEGALVYGEPRPIRGFEYLQEAMLVAESSDVRFWALQEMVSRRSSLDQADEAKQLITQYQDEFTSPSQQNSFNAWRAAADNLAARYAVIRENPTPVSLEEHIANLRDRLAAARDRGDEEEANRLQQLINITPATISEPK